ncbi:pancreatic alpha-amylase-like [Aplysia californica]|uniref:alpha-amylase n=1 Tax=Aplysia californica TaxID=6500 RepID=A0ABM0ZWB5_APLCA|nr:pancreatic alpha-amylase-like [Aplysia californica]
MVVLLALSLLPLLVSVSCVSDYHDPHCAGRQVIVHLFEWKWTDIAMECERYLGPKGFCGVQVNFNDRSKCPSHDGNINNYGDPHNVRDCNLVGLTDLDGSQGYVQDKIAGYFNQLIDLGVAGFRVDAAKHMWPQDITAMQAKTKDLPEGGRPFFFLEVIDRNDGAVKVNEYFTNGYVTEFRYSQKVKEGANDLGRLAGVYDPGWGMAPPDQALVFVDNHDSQRGADTLTYKVRRSF